jgi:hypothetical protein
VEIWQSAGGQSVESSCIITISANAIMEPIHERMLCRHEVVSIQAWPVSRELNRIGARNDERLIESVKITKTVTPAIQGTYISIQQSELALNFC